MTTKYIKAVRKSGNLYDAFYSDDNAFDPNVGWEYIERVARKYGYHKVQVDQRGYQPEGEPAEYTETVK